MNLKEISIILETGIKKCSELLARGQFTAVQAEIQKCIKILQDFKGKSSMSESRKKFYDAAVSFLGRDASPRDQADDELGCAESLNQIYKAAFGEFIAPIHFSKRYRCRIPHWPTRAFSEAFLFTVTGFCN